MEEAEEERPIYLLPMLFCQFYHTKHIASQPLAVDLPTETRCWLRQQQNLQSRLVQQQSVALRTTDNDNKYSILALPRLPWAPMWKGVNVIRFRRHWVFGGCVTVTAGPDGAALGLDKL